MADAEVAGELLGSARWRLSRALPLGTLALFGVPRRPVLTSGPKGCTGMLQILKTLFQDLSRSLRWKMVPL